MFRLALSVVLMLCFLLPAYAFDDTDEGWRTIDPALGIVAIVRTNLPNPPVFDAHFKGSQEKEFILYQWEPAICDLNFNGTCLWSGGNRWKRVLGISSYGGAVTGKGNVDCQAKVILTSWYKNGTQAWVQAKTDIVGYIPYKPSVPPNDKSIGVIVRFEDSSGGYGTVEFIYGCSP